MAMLEIVTGKLIELTINIGITQLVEISLLNCRQQPVKFKEPFVEVSTKTAINVISLGKTSKLKLSVNE